MINKSHDYRQVFCLNEGSGDNALQFDPKALEEMAQKNFQQINANLRNRCYLNLNQFTVTGFQKLVRDHIYRLPGLTSTHLNLEEFDRIFRKFHEEAPDLLKRLPKADGPQRNDLQLSVDLPALDDYFSD